MKAETKLTLRRLAIRWLRKLVDLVDDRLHAAEVRLRNELAQNKEAPAVDSRRVAGSRPDRGKVLHRVCSEPSDLSGIACESAGVQHRSAGSTPASRSNELREGACLPLDAPARYRRNGASESPFRGVKDSAALAQHESFGAFLSRRAGVAPYGKVEAKRHRERIRITAAAFDRRFA